MFYFLIGKGDMKRREFCWRGPNMIFFFCFNGFWVVIAAAVLLWRERVDQGLVERS